MDYSEEQIRAYLLGKLPEKDAEILENQMDEDPQLAEAIDLQRDIMVGIRAAFDDELRKKLIATHQETESNIRTMQPKALWRWAGAAAIMLGTLGVYFYMNQTSVDERLYYSYFEDFPNIIEPAQRDQTQGSDAFTAYEAKNWQLALAEFEKLALEQPTASYPYFYQGLAAMNLDQWPLAISALEKVRQGDDPRFVEAATWYVALAYLRNNDQERARLILETIADTPGFYRDDATAILGELN
jgi:hypothetical protein